MPARGKQFFIGCVYHRNVIQAVQEILFVGNGSGNIQTKNNFGLCFPNIFDLRCSLVIKVIMAAPDQRYNALTAKLVY